MFIKQIEGNEACIKLEKDVDCGNQYAETKKRVGKLEAGFIELLTESKKTMRDCNQLDRDFDNAQKELVTTFEMIFAIFMRFGSNTNSTKKPKESRF